MLKIRYILVVLYIIKLLLNHLIKVKNVPILKGSLETLTKLEGERNKARDVLKELGELFGIKSE